MKTSGVNICNINFSNYANLFIVLGDNMKDDLNFEHSDRSTFPTCLPPEHTVGSRQRQKVANSSLIPVRADQLIAFATGAGYKAYRDTANGSWYIKVLTEVLHDEYSSKKSEKRPQPQLIDVLTKVQREMSNLVTKDGDKNDAAQMPEFKSSLRGRIYLCKNRNSYRCSAPACSYENWQPEFVDLL